MYHTNVPSGKLRVRYMEILCTIFAIFLSSKTILKLKLILKIILIGIYLPHGDITEFFTIK